MALYMGNRDTQLSAMSFFFIVIKFSHLWLKIFPTESPRYSVCPSLDIKKLTFFATFLGFIGFSGPVYVKMRNITWLHHLSLHCYCIFFVVTKEIFPIAPQKCLRRAQEDIRNGILGNFSGFWVF